MRVAVILCVLVALPTSAWADCVYTGAKRAYLECIYGVALDTASEMVRTISEFRVITERVDTMETSLGTLEGRTTTLESDVTGLESRTTTLESDITGLESRTTLAEDAIISMYAENDGLETMHFSLAADVAAAETRLDALEAGGGGTRRTVCTRIASTASGSFTCSYAWIAANCSNGLPSGTCDGFISWAQQSGDDEDWRVFTPGESANGVSFPNGGMQWWNDQGCNNADVALRAVYDCAL